jgi:reactive intermediate/imine deaminase
MFGQDSIIRFINPNTMSRPFGYSHIAEVTSGRMIYISGQVALDPAGNLVGEGDMRAQAQQVFANLNAALEAVGADFSNVVKLNFYLLDISQVQAIRDVRDQYVNTQHSPTSTAVEVRRLFREDILIEVEAVAAVPA